MGSWANGTSLWRRALGKIVRVLARLRQGYDVPFMVAMVHDHGVRAAWRRLRELRRTSALLELRFGERDGQLLLAASAIRHGCFFCAVGHLRAANLAHFERTGELSPLDEALVPRLLGARERLVTLCECDELATTSALLTRQVALCDGNDDARDEQDRLLCIALAVYAGSDRTDGSALELIPPLSARVRDHLLRGRYEQARRCERLASGPLSRAG